MMKILFSLYILFECILWLNCYVLEFGGVDTEEYNCSVEYPCASLDFIFQSSFIHFVKIWIFLLVLVII
jgi:hypothetical protein